MSFTDGLWPLPQSWSWSSAAEIGDVLLGRQRSPENHSGLNMRPYVRSANITWSGWDLSDVKEMNFDEADFATFQLRAGDVLLNEGSGSANEVGKPAVWRRQIANCCFQNTLLCFRSDQVDPWYARAFFSFSARAGHLVKHTQGVNIFHIGKKGLEQLALPVAPPSEQRRIVAKIDRLSAHSKRAREELERVRTLVSRYREAVLNAAFRGALTKEWRAHNDSGVPSVLDVQRLRRETVTRRNSDLGRSRNYKNPVVPEWMPELALPTGWRWESVDSVTQLIQYGTSAKTNSLPDGVPVIRMGNIQDGMLDRSNLRYLPEEHDEFPTLLLDPGDVLFNRTNSFELVGKSAVYDGDKPESFASYLIRLKTVCYEPKLLVYYLNSAIGRQWVASVASQQVGQANVNGTKLSELGVPFMCLDEQREIVRRIEHAFAAIDRLAAEATAAQILLDRLDQAVLAKAFRGELVPQDPNDEPVSVLLERIRAERAAAPAPKRGRRPKASI